MSYIIEKQLVGFSYVKVIVFIIDTMCVRSTNLNPKDVEVGPHLTVSETIIIDKGCRHSSVESSAPSILLSRVRIPSIPSTSTLFLFSLLYYICYFIEKRTKINKKRPVVAHKKST